MGSIKLKKLQEQEDQPNQVILDSVRINSIMVNSIRAEMEAIADQNKIHSVADIIAVDCHNILPTAVVMDYYKFLTTVIMDYPKTTLAFAIVTDTIVH